MYDDLSKIKPGEYIWTIQSGWTRIVEIATRNVYPIITENASYTFKGYLGIDNIYPSAFTIPPIGFNVEPKPCEFKKGDRVLVNNGNTDATRRRYFSHIASNGSYACFHRGATEWSADNFVTHWINCRAATEDD